MCCVHITYLKIFLLVLEMSYYPLKVTVDHGGSVDTVEYCFDSENERDVQMQNMQNGKNNHTFGGAAIAPQFSFEVH